MKRCLLVFCILLSACSTVPTARTTSPSATEAPTPTPAEPELPKRTTPTQLPAASEFPHATEDLQPFLTYPPSSLSVEGPWLVIFDESSRKMTALNQDGSGPTNLDLPQPIPNAEIKGDRGKNIFAYISGSDDFSNPELELILVELPGGTVFDRIALIESDWLEKDLPDSVEEKDLYQADVVQSIVEDRSFAWSPGGRYLAYIAATEGPSGDVYVYDTQDRSTKHLTTGSGQAALLSWSPDGAWIVHLAVRTFCCGAGWNVEAMWAADPTGDTIEQVTSGGGMFFIQKWLGGQSFIMTRWTAAFGLEDLFLVDIPSQRSTLFLDAPLQEYAFNASGDVVALYLDTIGAENYGVAPGIYTQPVKGETQILVLARTDPLSLEYSAGVDRFVAGLMKETILFNHEGEITLRIPIGGEAEVSPDGARIAIYSQGEHAAPGLHVVSSAGEKTVELTKLPIQDAFWGLDSRGVFALVEGRGTVFFEADTGERFLVDVPFPHDRSMTWVGK